MATVGVLHPGAMGAAVGGQLTTAGHQVLWASAGRSEATAHRARLAGMFDVHLRTLLQQAEIVISVCPPANAEAVAQDATSYDGIWVEANAVAPQRVSRIAALLPGALTIDGAIIGSPPRDGKRTSLYLSGPLTPVSQVEDLFSGTTVEIRRLGDALGSASALKLAYSGHQKASRVLAAVAYALATDHGVADELLEIASRRTGSYLAEVEYIPQTAARAWRWGPEMLEVAETLAAARLPNDLARATAAILSRWPRPAEGSPIDLDEALKHLRSSPQG